jgi:hypothetical protein
MTFTRWSAMCIVILATGSLSACNPAQRARQAKDEVHSGNVAACVQERSTIEKAVEAFTLLHPDQAVTEAAMITAGIVREQSVLMDIAADGTVIPAPGTVCA